MSEPPNHPNPGSPEPDDDALALAMGATGGEPMALPEPVLGNDEDGVPDFGAPDGAGERPPFLGAAREGETDDASTDDLPAPRDGNGEAAAPPDDEVVAPTPRETARARRTWRQLRYASITQDKPVAV